MVAVDSVGEKLFTHWVADDAAKPPALSLQYRDNPSCDMRKRLLAFPQQ